MSRSELVRSSDARAVSQLLGDVRDLAADPVAWRAEFVRGLLLLVDGTVGISVEAYGWGKSPRPRCPVLIDLGWRGVAERKDFFDYSNTNRFDADPMIAAARGKHLQPYTIVREEWVDDRTWYASANVSVGRHFCDINPSIASSRPLAAAFGSEGTDHLSLHRPWRGRRFGKRELGIIGLAHDSLVERFSDQTNRTLAANVRQLPPQLRRLYQYRLQGLNEKDTAELMKLRVNTVHFYVRLLHERLGIRSHVELLARAGRERDSRPRLFGDPKPQRPILSPIDPNS